MPLLTVIHLMRTGRTSGRRPTGPSAVPARPTGRYLFVHGWFTDGSGITAAGPGENKQPLLLACIACVPGRSVTSEELRAHLSGRVVKWCLPEQWAFVADVPRTSVGKHDKKLLRERYAEGSLPVVTSNKPPEK